MKRLNRFFSTVAALEKTWECLREMHCEFCGRLGTLRRHGTIKGYISLKETEPRAWRVCCRSYCGGCGRTLSLRLAERLPRRTITTEELWRFVQALMRGDSIKAAWEYSGIRLHLENAYRIRHRLLLVQPVLRTRLCSRAPPPTKNTAGSPLLQVFDHLQAAFGTENPISTYQEVLQRDFLATV